MPVITGAASYPENIFDKLDAIVDDLIVVDALRLAEEAGSAKAVNVVLMGVASRTLGFSEEAWQNALTACVPEKFLELNKKAFVLGQNR